MTARSTSAAASPRSHAALYCPLQTHPACERGHIPPAHRKPKKSPPRAPVIVSGVVTKGDKDFTPAAAQVAHNKPLPGVPKLPPAQHINQHIHQPRK
uniref:Death-associated protein n=1 Tax=Haplochromis burtoni TaxID=8153 RepID=A0A3Q2W701_HAPBU